MGCAMLGLPTAPAFTPSQEGQKERYPELHEKLVLQAALVPVWTLKASSAAHLDYSHLFNSFRQSVPTSPIASSAPQTWFLMLGPWITRQRVFNVKWLSQLPQGTLPSRCLQASKHPGCRLSRERAASLYFQATKHAH